MRCLFPVLAALLLWTPIAASAANRDEYAGIHTVAVVSAIGDTLHFTVAPRIFSLGGSESLSIASWGIDPSVAAQITQAVGTRFSVKTIPVDASAVAKCDGREQCAGAMPHTDQVDAYIVAYKAVAPDPISGNGDIFGLGMYHHQGLLGMADVHSVYAIFAVAVVNARTGEVIDYGTAKLPEAHFLGEHFNPIEAVPESTWPDNPPVLTADQQATVKQTLMRLISTTLPYALHSAHLAP
jgi:hypothetical protein